MNRRVVDASAALAALKGEPGGDRLLARPQSLISSVNVAEVLTRLIDLGFDEDRARVMLGRLGLEVSPFLPADAEAAAALRNRTRHLGLSIGDRACLALARGRGLAALTADRSWAELDIDVEVELIR